MSASQRRRRAQQLRARAKRVQQQKAQNDPAKITAPLTPKTLGQETAAAVRAKFGPAEQQLKGEVGASNQMQANLGSWFDDFLHKAQGAQGSSQQGYQDATGQLAQIASAARGNDAAAHAATAKELQADAANRGATVDTNDATASQASDARGQLLTILGGQLAKQGAAANDYFGGRVATTSGQGAQAKLNEGTHLRAIQGKQRDLATQKGDFASQYKATARDKERTFGLQEQALGVKQNTAAASQDLQVQKLKLAAKALGENTTTKRRGQDIQQTSASDRNSTTRRGQDLSHQDRQAAIDAKKKGKKGGPTRAKRLEAKEGYKKGLLNAQKDKPSKADKMGYVTYLTTLGVKPEVAEAAVQTYFYKGVNTATRRKVKHLYGINVPAMPAQAVNPLHGILPGV